MGASDSETPATPATGRRESRRASAAAAARIARIIESAEGGLLRLDEPVRLSSGAMSSEFIDVKAALASKDSLRLAAAEIVRLVRGHAGIAWDAAGGLTMGADAIAVAVACEAGGSWFSVRKQPKDRGTARLIEGARIGPGWRVLVIEDVTTTGASALKAAEAVEAAGAEVVAVAAIVNRGDTAETTLAPIAAPYFYLAGYADLGIAPVVPPADDAGTSGGASEADADSAPIGAHSGGEQPASAPDAPTRWGLTAHQDSVGPREWEEFSRRLAWLTDCLDSQSLQYKIELKVGHLISDYWDARPLYADAAAAIAARADCPVASAIAETAEKAGLALDETENLTWGGLEDPTGVSDDLFYYADKINDLVAASIGCDPPANAAQCMIDAEAAAGEVGAGYTLNRLLTLLEDEAESHKERKEHEAAYKAEAGRAAEESR